MTATLPYLPVVDLAAIYRRAAEVISRNGLAKGAFVAPPAIPDSQKQLHASDESLRPVDMTGAIRIACGMTPTASGGFVAMAAIQFASLHMPGQAPWTDGEPDYIEHLADYTDLTSCEAPNVVGRFLMLAIDADMAVAS
jgi:hypothetical protein